MREIKFRAIIQGENKFTYSNGFMKHKDGIVIIITKELEEHFETSPIIENTLCQFTGLKDKNGKEIYEGDILFNSNKTLLTLKQDKRLYLVKWQEGEYNEDGNWLKNKPSFVFEKIITNGKKYMDLIFSKDQIEVIGNIYENTELLNN